MANDPLGVPEIQDKRTKPSGLLPKNAQTWALAGVALVMVLVIMFSGRSAPKQVPKDPPPPPIVDPNLPRIDDVRKRIDEMANKNRAEQERIAALQAGMASPAMPTPTGQAYPAAATPPAYGGRGYAYQDLNPQRSWVDPEEQKRESRAPFASNIALSYRKEDQSTGRKLRALTCDLWPQASRMAATGRRPPVQARHNAPPKAECQSGRRGAHSV